jgi:hypothetical protein
MLIMAGGISILLVLKNLFDPQLTGRILLLHFLYILQTLLNFELTNIIYPLIGSPTEKNVILGLLYRVVLFQLL